MLFGIISALLISLYAGYVLVKYSEFRNVREEACRVITQVETTADEWDKPLREAAISMRRLGHRKAAETLFEVAEEIHKMYGSPPKSEQEILALFQNPDETLSKFFIVQEMRKVVESLRPSIKVLLLRK
ncbi:hypothetical protein AKH05_22665 [Vibrio parahaemolyticus]|uniref:hypothetical protein n=1 Tax=Vibrio parahaemolyticus TaxID=670 RepID=UPI000813AA45|nr:hypothetical protein [Vibrio parahaemolyticus]OCP52941.1 hypothetical protein AKH05_22665 [Vibrio parahaemolyticus]